MCRATWRDRSTKWLSSRGRSAGRSGQTSTEYFDKLQFTSRPELLEAVAELTPVGPLRTAGVNGGARRGEASRPR